MNIEIPTDKIALQIWWAMAWRSIPLVIICSILASLAISLVITIVGIDPKAMQGPSMLIGAIVGLYVSIKVIKYLMTKGFGEYRLVVVKK